MTELDFISSAYKADVFSGEFIWQSPSNIALVKYWGKKENQIPANPSISFTLDACRTITQLEFQKKETSSNLEFQVYFDGQRKESFEPKIHTFFERVIKYLPFLKAYSFVIRTKNTFPHSSGIASSASGMSALALCLMSLEKELNPDMTTEYFFNKASFLARLGSGSACRSISGDIVSWGAHEGIPSSNDLFGTVYPFPVHDNFKNYQDSILLVDKGEKKVSSTLGHDLMNGHPFAERRFLQAHQHMDQLKEIFEEGNLSEFVKIVESEALTLHGMMMTSQPYFLLMKPNTLEIINRVFNFREETGLHLCFTLDAGANVHLLYPEKEKTDTLEFIKRELTQFCQNGQFIADHTGKGAVQIK